LILRSDNGPISNNPAMREFCEQVSSDIAGYLMAKRVQ
jgi:hypothetical protein